MITKKPYTYTVLRYVHDVTTGEFVNVGLVVHAPSVRFLRAKMRHTHGRLSSMFPDLDRDSFRSSMKVIERAIDRLGEEYQKASLFTEDSDAASFAKSVLPADDSSLQWSPVGSGLASDLTELLERLFDRLVGRYDEKPDRNKKQDDDVWRPIRDRLEQSGIADRLGKTVIRGKVDEVPFKHAWKNGVWHCYEALSFDLADADNIKDKARRWTGHLAAVRDVADQFKPHFIVGAPSDRHLMKAYNEALAILETSPVKPEVFSENEADKLVERIEAEIASHH
ncbi:MAG: DUF3037 domain-containing protein [Proteobacteria bacterium]|nr:DUF3037 domain-containing protein [Pseudomonadota bacterium]